MPEHLIISDDVSIPMSDIELAAVRSPGAGGQNVNKVASAVHLRFDIPACDALPERVKDRLMALDDRRITADGVLIMKAREFRTQERNRQAALDRLRELIAAVLVEKKPRKKTRVTKQEKEKRIENKRRRGQLKRSRSNIDD